MNAYSRAHEIANMSGIPDAKMMQGLSQIGKEEADREAKQEEDNKRKIFEGRVGEALEALTAQFKAEACNAGHKGHFECIVWVLYPMPRFSDTSVWTPAVKHEAAVRLQDILMRGGYFVSVDQPEKGQTRMHISWKTE